MDPSERKERILGENKGFFHAFYAHQCSALSHGINYPSISGKYNLFRLICYANNLRSLGGEVFYNVQAFCNLSAAKNQFALLNVSAMAAEGGEGGTVIVVKCL